MDKSEFKAKYDEILKAAQDALGTGDVAKAKELRAQAEELFAAQKAYDEEQAAQAKLLEQQKALADEEARLKAEQEAQAKAEAAKIVAPAKLDNRKEETKMNNSKMFALANKLTKRSGMSTDFETVNAEAAKLEAFALFLQGKDYDAGLLEIRNTATGLTDVVCPQTVVDEIWRLMGDRHPVLNYVSRMNIKGNITLPKATAEGDDATWYAESDTVSEGTMTIGSITLAGYELARAVKITWKAELMGIDALIPFISKLIADKMAGGLANAIINGKGIPGTNDTWKAQPLGLVYAMEQESSTPQVVTYNSSIAYSDLMSALGKIKAGYDSKLVIFAKRATIFNQLALVKDGDNAYIFKFDTTGEGVGHICGIPVVTEDAVATDAVLIANFEDTYALNVQEDLQVAPEKDVFGRITKYMGYAIADGKPRTTLGGAYIKKSQ